MPLASRQYIPHIPRKVEFKRCEIPSSKFLVMFGRMSFERLNSSWLNSSVDFRKVLPYYQRFRKE